MSRAEIHKQPSVEELLVSIRQAIHGDGASSLPLPAKNQANGSPLSGSPLSGSMSQTRVSLQSNNGKPGGFTRQHTENFFKLRNQLKELGADAPHAAKQPRDKARSNKTAPKETANGFAGILNGDVRLEEALEKLKRAGLGDDHTEPDETIRAGHLEFDEAEYTLEEQGDYEDHYAEEIEPKQFDQVEDGFSPDTRQSYIDPITPAQAAPEPEHHLKPPVGQALAPSTASAAPPEAGAPLTSAASAAETSAAFNRLADTIVGHATTGERSIDEITRQLLHPMLQSWLDEHLPRLVERLVREEIERVARWGGK